MKHLVFLLYIFAFNSNASVNVNTFTGTSLANGNEEVIQLSNFAKPIVLIFLSKDCPCSKGNLGYINDLSKNYPDFKFIGIHSKKGTSLNAVKDYLNDKKVNFEILNDASLTIANAFNALKTPHVFIVNPNGEVIYSGGVSNSTFPQNSKELFLKNALEDLKNNRPIAKNETKSLGCIISR
jgi:peroxiredoxin